MVPAVSKLDREQAAAAFMLGESQGTSAGGASEAGKFLRIPGTNPFFAYRDDWQGNRFYELLQQVPLEVYLLNTGRVGGPEGDERSKNVSPEHTSAVVRGIISGSIQWDNDPTFGTLVASSVPGIDDIELLQPWRLYERQAPHHRVPGICGRSPRATERPSRPLRPASPQHLRRRLEPNSGGRSRVGRCAIRGGAEPSTSSRRRSPGLVRTGRRCSGRPSPTAVFALGPMLVIATGIAGIVYGEEASQGLISEQISETVGPEVASLIEQLVSSAGQGGAGVAATVFGGVLLLISASALILQLEAALSAVFDDEHEEKGLKATLFKRLRGIAGVLIIGVMLLIIVGANAVVRFVADRLTGVAREAVEWGTPLVSLVLVAGLLGAHLPLPAGHPDQVAVGPIWRRSDRDPDAHRSGGHRLLPRYGERRRRLRRWSDRGPALLHLLHGPDRAVRRRADRGSRRRWSTQAHTRPGPSAVPVTGGQGVSPPSGGKGVVAGFFAGFIAGRAAGRRGSSD